MRNKILSDISEIFVDGMTLSDFCEEVDYNTHKVMYLFDSWTNAKVKAGVEEANKCPNCDKYYSRLSVHWNGCGEPELSEEQKSIITGAVMSDATVSVEGSVTMYSSNREFLEWMDEKLSFMSYGITLNDSGEDRHMRNIKAGFDVKREANYKDIYRLSIPSHSFTKGLRKLYKKDGKELYTLNLNEDIIKVWYSGDGGLNWSDDKYAYPEIRAISQSKFDDKIDMMFDDFPVNSFVSNGNIRFYSDADDFLEMIGPSPKGMEYKWENKNRDRYNKLKPE